MDKDTRTYSIIVVTYNNAEGLHRTLESIRLLDYSKKEIIVIDGGSQDNTTEVVHEYDNIITTFVSEKDNGVYNAMNKGIKYVTADYVVFMNAGDFFSDSDVLTLVNEYEADIILGGEIYDGTVRNVKPQMTLYDILSIGINHQAVYYRQDILKKYGFDESYRISADLKSVVEPLAKDNISLACIPEILATCEGGGISKKFWKETINEKRRMIDEVIDPLYRDDYLKFAFVNNTLLDDFIIISYFKKTFPIITCLAKAVAFINKKIKHIPIG